VIQRSGVQGASSKTRLPEPPVARSSEAAGSSSIPFQAQSVVLPEAELQDSNNNQNRLGQCPAPQTPLPEDAKPSVFPAPDPGVYLGKEAPVETLDIGIAVAVQTRPTGNLKADSRTTLSTAEAGAGCVYSAAERV